MSFFKNMIKNIVDHAVQNAQREVSSSNRSLKIGGKTVDEWERLWRHIGTLSSLELSEYNHSVGLYRAELGGKIMYIGRAVEYNNGGLRKRLSDYTRDSDSGRKHGSGRKMFEHCDRLSISIIITGNDEDGVTIARQLEPMLIGKYRPEWNKVFNS